MNNVVEQHGSTYAPMHFGDFVTATDGALSEWLEVQPPGASVEIATRQYYAIIQVLAKHLSKAAHNRKLHRAQIAIDQ